MSPARVPDRLDTLEARMMAFYQGDPLDFEEVTVSTVAVGLNPHDMAATAEVQAQGANVRMRLDGEPPTATSGHRIADGSSVTLTGRRSLEIARFIREGAVDAELAVHYFG